VTEKKKNPTNNEVEDLKEQLTFMKTENNIIKKHLVRLERALARLAHQTGSDNILRGFQIDVFVPGKEDMKRWKN
jgi:regulator of replication initiation timing